MNGRDILWLDDLNDDDDEIQRNGMRDCITYAEVFSSLGPWRERAGRYYRSAGIKWHWPPNTNDRIKKGLESMHSKQFLRFGHDLIGRNTFVIPQFWLACLLAMMAFPAACARSKTVTWQEEVKLSTGEVIVVERETRFIPADTGRPKDSSWAADTMTLRFRYPPSSKEVIEWRTVRQATSGGGNYSSPETPLVLDLEQDTKSFYVITQNGGHGCDEYYRYRYGNGAWYDDMLPEIFETRAPNMWIGSKQLDTPPQTTLDYKRGVDYQRLGYNIRLRQIGPDRCLCGHIGNPVKSGCAQKYKFIKE